MFEKAKYYIIPMKKRSDDSYEQLRKPLRVNIVNEMKIWKNKTFVFTLAEVARHYGNKHYIYKDVDTGEAVLQWGKTGEALPPDGIKQRNKERLMDKAMQVNPHDYGLLTIIVVGIAAAMIGVVAMIFAYPSLFPQMMAHTTNSSAVVVR